MLRIKLFVVLLMLFNQHFKAQQFLEIGYSCGANATLSRTVQSDNMTWGYYTPPFPSTWTNHLFVTYGTKGGRVELSFDDGALGPTWRAHGYTDKYPYDDQPSSPSNPNLSTATHYQGGSRTNSKLLKFCILYKHNWLSSKKFQHNSMIGLGYLKTRVASNSNSSVMSFYNDSLGWVSSGMVLDKYEYFRNENVYFTFGYEFKYNVWKGIHLNAQVFYNQGLYKMIRWHTYRVYSESLTGYTEFDEQWSFTRLSYFAFLGGVSYEFKIKEKKK